jgi:hypothetical protein
LKSIEKSLCRVEVGGVEALGKAVVDRLEERQGASGKVLIAQQPSEGGNKAISGDRVSYPTKLSSVRCVAILPVANNFETDSAWPDY